NAASAHQNMWFTIETTMVYEKGTFTGLRQKWTFDEFYTAFAIEGLDKNHDGIYDRQELAELAKVNIEGLKEFHYFTYPLLAGKEIKLKDAQDYWLEHKDGVLSLLFTVLFDQPILTDAGDFAFVVEDPTYYIAFVPAKVDAVKLGEGAPSSCKARVGRRSDDAEAEQLAKAFAQLAIRVAAQSVVSVDCKGH